MEQPASRTQPLSYTSKKSQIERLSDMLLLGLASKNPHGTGGCRTRVHASGCCNNPHKSKGCQLHCCWEVSRLVEAAGISRDVPAKTLKASGCCNNPHRSNGCQTRCCWEVHPRISRDVTANALAEPGCRTVVDVVYGHRERPSWNLLRRFRNGCLGRAGRFEALGGPQAPGGTRS